jgi:hypothetical protein
MSIETQEFHAELFKLDSVKRKDFQNVYIPIASSLKLALHLRLS